MNQSIASAIHRLRTIILVLLLASIPALHAADKSKALIVDGHNNHQVWPKSTVMMKQYLEATGLFEVDVARTKYVWSAEREAAFLALADAGESEMVKDPRPDPTFKPDFANYAVVISNFGWKAADWPEETQRAFEKYVAGGGGFVSVHAADNSWGNWTEFNKMIALGGWGDRTEKDGPFVYYNSEGKIVRDPRPGKAGKHGPPNQFVVTVRNREHPITKGLPDFWMHTQDECYSHLRGPAENLTILATACDSPELKGEGRHEPMLMTVEYHHGRVFHTTLGHDTEAFEGVGFITTFLRGTEWAATGKVTQRLPADFPSSDKPSARPFKPAGAK
jgi:type 1 glutamine amidotransferase